MAFKQLYSKLFGKSKEDEEYEKAMKSYGSRQVKSPVKTQELQIDRDKQTTIDEDISLLQKRQAAVKKKVAPFTR